jgi:hypothetical protein
MELALGTLLLVSVVLLGLHMSEVAFLSLKTTEAAALGLWESTGRRVHYYGRRHQAEGGERIYESWGGELLPSAGPRVQDRYFDFDGRASRSGGAMPTQVATQAAPMSVTCRDDDTLAFRMVLFGDEADRTNDRHLQNVRGVLRDLYRPNVGGMRCSASAALMMARAPRRFLDGPGEGGFFKEALWEMDSLQVCGSGRAVGGTCRGSFGILLGDWSLDAPRNHELTESTMHWDAATGNDMQPYRSLVRSLYEANGDSRGRAASRFAQVVGGEQRSPHDESTFYMSYAGVEWDYEDWDYVDPDQWRQMDEIHNTAGVYGDKKNRACYLGLPCN